MQKRLLLAIPAALVVLVAIAACGGALDDSDDVSQLAPQFAPTQPAGLPDMDRAPVDGVSDEASAGGLPLAEGDDPPFYAQGGGTGGAGGPGEGPALQGQLDRKIVRTAHLRLTVENVRQGLADVERIAATSGGFVSESSLTTESARNEEEEPRQTATITIRVPAESYASAMSQLRGIADEVRSESSDASEVTEEYTDLQSRLRTLEATEERYLELLSQAESIPDILTVQDRLNSVRSEIERIQGRLNLLDDLTDLATISVQLDPPDAPIEVLVEEDDKGWAQEAWDTAWSTSADALKVMGTIGIALGVLAIWLAVPAAVVLVAWRLFGQRGAGKGAA